MARPGDVPPGPGARRPPAPEAPTIATPPARTGPVPPAREPAPAAVPAEVDPLWFARIDEAIRSLRTAGAVAVVVALAAAGIAAWALVKANDANRQSASAQRVSALDDRVSALESRLNGLDPAAVRSALAKAATSTDVNALRASLQKTQSDLAKATSTNATAITQANQRIDALSKQVTQLQSQQSSGTTTTTTSSSSSTT